MKLLVSIFIENLVAAGRGLSKIKTRSRVSDRFFIITDPNIGIAYTYIEFGRNYYVKYSTSWSRDFY